MLRRVVPLLVIATVALAFWSLRGGSRGEEPASGSPLVAPVAQGPDPEPSTLSSSHSTSVREALHPGQAVAERSRGKQAPGRALDSDTVTGRVVDDKGTPVTQFSIEARRIASDVPREQGAVRIEQAFESPGGSFALDALSGGQWELAASTPAGRRSAREIISVPGAPEGIELVIPRSGTLSGFVVERAGTPVVDAQVYLHYPGEEELDFAFGDPPEPRARTDGRGSFRIEDVSPGSLEIMARHPEFADGEWHKLAILPGALVQGVELELRAGGRIEGHVDPSLGDAADRGIGLFSFRGAIGWRDASTDATGHFVIEHVMPQDYVIELRPASYGKPQRQLDVQDEPGIRKNISVKEGETTQVVFGEARRLIAVHGLLQSGGAPAPGWDVRPYSQENEDRGAKARTGLDGRFELTLPGPGDYWLCVSETDDTYASFRQAVPDQSDLEVVLELPSGALSGHVLDSDGRPLGHVGITLVRTDCAREVFYRECYRRTHSGSDGRFRFRLLAPGSYTLRAPDGFQWDSPPSRWPHGRIVLTDLVVSGAEVAGIVVRLPEEGQISGVVVDERGNPVTNAWIGALDRTGLPLAAEGWDTRPDASGHFQIGNVAPGTYSVRARSGEKEARTASFEVEAWMTASVRIELR